MKNEEGEIMPKIQQSFESPITEAANLSAAFTPQSHLDSVQKKLDFTSQSGDIRTLNDDWLERILSSSDECMHEILELLISESSVKSLAYIKVSSVHQDAANAEDSSYAAQAASTAMSFALSALNSVTDYAYSFVVSEKSPLSGESESLDSDSSN
jgi:hypothetical protein